MSDLKDRIVQKLQAGGGLSLRGEYRITPTKIYHDPNRANQQQVRGPSGGYAKKAVAAASGKKEDPLYRSYEIMKEDVQASMNQQLAALQADENLSPEELQARQAQVMYTASMETKRINEEGLQFKDALDYFNTPGSRAKEVAYEYVIKPDNRGGFNPQFLTEFIDDQGGRHYAFSDMATAFQSEGAVKPITVQSSISYAKQDPNFIYFLNKNGISDYAAMIVGVVSHDNLEDDVKDFFDSNSIETKQEGTELVIGNKIYNSAEFSAKNDQGANVLTQKYMPTLSSQNKARFQVEAYTRNQNFFEYMNQFLLNRAGIDYTDEGDSGKGKSSAPTKVTSLFTSGPSAVEAIDITAAPLSEEASDDMKDNIDNATIVGVRQTRTIPNGGRRLFPNRKTTDLDATMIGTSDFAGTLGLDGTRNVKFSSNMSDVEDVLGATLQMDKAEAERTVIKTGVRTNSSYPIKVTYGVGFHDQNGKSSGDLERMMLTLSNMIRGADYAKGVEPTKGLYAGWVKELERPTEDDYRKNNKQLLAVIEEGLERDGVLTEEQIAEEIGLQVTEGNNKLLLNYRGKAVKLAQKKFNEQIINGDAIEIYLKGQGVPEAETVANNYKSMLERKYSIVPQLSFMGQLVFTEADYAEQLGSLIAGEVDVDLTEVAKADLGVVYQIDPAEIAGLWQGPMVLDLVANASSIEAAAEFIFDTDFDINSYEGKLQIQALADRYSKPRDLSSVDTYLTMPWLNVK